LRLGICESEMKQFIRHSRQAAEQLKEALNGLRADVKLALTHYSPAQGARPASLSMLTNADALIVPN
jgi:hypothetical protein